VTRASISEHQKGQGDLDQLHPLDRRMDAKGCRNRAKLDSTRSCEVAKTLEKSRLQVESGRHDQGSWHFWSATDRAGARPPASSTRGRGESHQGDGMRAMRSLERTFSRGMAIGFIHEPSAAETPLPERHRGIRRNNSCSRCRPRARRFYECKAGADGKRQRYAASRIASYCSTARTVGRIHAASTLGNHIRRQRRGRKSGGNAPARRQRYPWLKIEVTSHRCSASSLGSTRCRDQYPGREYSTAHARPNRPNSRARRIRG